jgi:UV DNA damage endonuclease
VHFSSPKSISEFRSHSDYLNPQDFLKFLLEAKELEQDFDIMLEAKQKDGALFQLVKELQSTGEVEIINNGILKL